MKRQRAQVREIVVADKLAYQQDNVVAIYVIAFVSQYTFRVCANGKALRLGVGDVIRSLDLFLGRLQFEVASGELLHGRRANEPRADAEARRGGLEQFSAADSRGKTYPAAGQDSSVDGRAHVADDVGFIIRFRA